MQCIIVDEHTQIMQLERLLLTMQDRVCVYEHTMVVMEQQRMSCSHMYTY